MSSPREAAPPAAMDADEAAAEGTRDGRIARGIRTRCAILVAYEELITTGDGPPTGAELAERAGVSPRSVFTHFRDMDGVLAAAAGRAFEWLVATHVDIPLDLPIAERIDRYTQRQAETLERTEPLYRTVRALRRTPRREGTCSPPVRDILGSMNEIRRNYIAYLFQRELAAASEASHDDLFEALVAITSWNQWMGLRMEQNLDIDRACAAMRLGLRGLLLGGSPA